MRIETNTTWFALALGLLVMTTTTPASAFDVLGDDGMTQSVAGKNIAAAEDEDDDDEAFFSGGSNPAVQQFTGSVNSRAPSAGLQRQTYASVDVAAVCRAVLAESSSSYNKGFYEGCRKAVGKQPIRRAAR